VRAHFLYPLPAACALRSSGPAGCPACLGYAARSYSPTACSSVLCTTGSTEPTSRLLGPPPPCWLNWGPGGKPRLMGLAWGWHGVGMGLACGVGMGLAWGWHGVGMGLAWGWHGAAWGWHGVGMGLEWGWHGVYQLGNWQLGPYRPLLAR
jgi:hypothetical protein